MKKLLYVSIFTFCLVIALCSNQTENRQAVEISIDFDNLKKIDLSNGREINLEFTDNSIIKRVDEFKVYDETHYLVRSGRDLLLFEADGGFRNRIGRIGNGPMEFTHFNSFFIKKDTVHIFDAMAKKMVLYDLNDNFLDYVSLSDTYTDIKPNYIYPISNDKFVSKNTYGGENNPIFSYSILDKNYKVISHIKNRYLKDGITSLNNFFADDHSVLFWELLNDTIFSVTDDSNYDPKYFINFNKKSLPQRIKNLDLYDAIEFTKKPENRKKYASLIRCVYEDVDYLRFIFIYDEDVYYVKSDKNNDTTQTYKLSYNDRQVEPIIYFKNNRLVIPVNSYEGEANPTLVILDESLL